jgi:hypothetical protein
MRSRRDKTTDFTTLWYRPHFQCGLDGTDSQAAAEFINGEMMRGTDFVGISEYEADEKIGIDGYGVFGAVCGYGSENNNLFSEPIALFFNIKTWSLDAAYPSAPSCRRVPRAPWDESCIDKLKPGTEDCCSCSYSAEEFQKGGALNEQLNNRAWLAGKFTRHKDKKAVCIVGAGLPHPVGTQSISNIDMVGIDPSVETLLWSACTNDRNRASCLKNSDGTSIIFGTSVFVTEVRDFCGDVPIVFMGDTNASNGDFPTGEMFLIEPLSKLADAAPLVPCSCCNDTFDQDGTLGIGFMHFASDRIAVSGDKLAIKKLEGGAKAPGGEAQIPLPCKNHEEHAPLRAEVFFF